MVWCPSAKLYLSDLFCMQLSGNFISQSVASVGKGQQDPLSVVSSLDSCGNVVAFVQASL